MDKKEKKKDRTILIYIGLFLFIILLRTFIVTPVVVDGSSMYPTLENNDVLILNKVLANKIERFNIVVINYKDERLIKRVIGLPGEVIKYQDNKLYINDVLYEENYNREKTNDFSIDTPIKDNCYFVLGDNRNDSTDSRVFGCVDKKDILGRADLVIFPFNKFGFKS